MVAAIPISIVLGVTDHFAALLVAWIGIVLVNMAHALQSRPRDDSQDSLAWSHVLLDRSRGRAVVFVGLVTWGVRGIAGRAHEPGTRHLD